MGADRPCAGAARRGRRLTDPDAPADDRDAPHAPTAAYAAVAVEVEPFHLDRPFDYLVPEGMDVRPGMRVQVVFAGRVVRALVLEVRDGTDVPRARLRPVRRTLGDHAWMTPDEIDVARWAAARWGAPLGDVLRHALPGRVVDVERRGAAAGWYPEAARPASPPPPPQVAIGAYGPAGTALAEAARAGGGAWFWRPTPDEDVPRRLAELAQRTLAGGRDVLAVVPDPASPTADALVEAAGDLAVDVRGGPSARRLYRAWLEARCGRARMVVGERGAAFWPLRRLGLAVVLDEANPALKERRSPRHHVRDVALERARRAGAAAVLVGDVPSAVAWRLLAQGRIVSVAAPRALERRAAPRVEIADQRGTTRTRLARSALGALRRAVREGRYGVVLSSRRGEGRLLACSRCGERLRCAVCDAGLAPLADRVRCERCGRVTGSPTCPGCGGARFAPLAAGAERVAEELRRAGLAPVAALEGYAAPPPPPPAVLVTTRGAVLDRAPGPVGAVVLADLDAMLRRPALDAAEDALRLSLQLARWAAAAGGQVIAQTRAPDHHAVQALAGWRPDAFWRAESRARAEVGFPPVTEAVQVELGDAAADDELLAALPAEVTPLGPLPVDGRRRWLVTGPDRREILAALRPLRERWSRDGAVCRVDVDPVD